jgi:hypothetical protein
MDRSNTTKMQTEVRDRPLFPTTYSIRRQSAKIDHQIGETPEVVNLHRLQEWSGMIIGGLAAATDGGH